MCKLIGTVRADRRDRHNARIEPTTAIHEQSARHTRMKIPTIRNRPGASAARNRSMLNRSMLLNKSAPTILTTQTDCVCSTTGATSQIPGLKAADGLFCPSSNFDAPIPAGEKRNGMPLTTAELPERRPTSPHR